ncbi:hypothetical protein [Paracerasibacillus soli]|uniref:Uncharacterized protein n=1 Tax=Paracerasibacillus soli TaxID=480284 RepID=A0ABU5CTB4_9BACI|nr:hypothetical protein [Virgibacillus soli]MDY0409064.1 hypothetical protein [Virgibacillus soli]
MEENRRGLIKLNKELEDRVKERTVTLENKNMELKAVNKLITSVSTERDLAQFIQHCWYKLCRLWNMQFMLFFKISPLLLRKLLLLRNWNII